MTRKNGPSLSERRSVLAWRSSWLCLAALLAGLCPLQGQTQQLRADAKEEGWGDRQSNTSGGKLLWYEHDNGTNTDDVYLYNGASAALVQAQGGLTGVGDGVFALGTGASAGHVIAAWRRETDFAWISVDGGTPVPVVATNPIDSIKPLNPEGAGIADGCVFLILQGFSGAFARKFVYRVDPATGNATILTDPATFPITGSDDGVPRITTSGCKAAWRFFDGSGTIKLHFFDGSSVSVIDSGDVGLPHMSQGRVVYTKTVAGVSQVFLYDSNLASPAPVALTSYADPAKVNSQAKTDGRHVAWLRQNLDNTNRQIVLNGDVPLTNSATKPADGAIFVDFPIQLQRNQLLWTDAAGNLRYAHDGSVSTISISPGTSVIRAWLADGYVTFTGLSNDGGTDTEPFRFTGTAPSDTQPSPPLLLAATPGNGRVTLVWDRVLAATAYNLYYATVSGVTKGNYASLPGGTKITGATSPNAITGLTNGTTYSFVVTAVDGGGEGPDSAEASPTPKAPLCVSPGDAGCYATIQAAVDAAAAGDTIRVTAGTYIESKIVGAFDNNLLIDRTLTLEGGWNGSFTVRNPATFVTTLRPSNADFSVVDIEGQFGNPDAVAPVLDGFTITGALGGNHGGGVRIRDSNATIRNCVITGNQAYLLGGGIWVQRGAPRLEKNRIDNNSLTPGGSGGGVELEGTQATLVGNTITGNQIADVVGSGGGVAIDGGGLVTLTDNTITNNAAANQAGTADDKSYGGGVSVNGATALLSGNLIQGNSANSTQHSGVGNGNGSGGGVYVLNSTAFTLTDNTISNNIAGYQYYQYLLGGGLMIDSSQGQMSGNVISNNKANGNILFGNGAGLAVASSTLTIRGGQILNNSVSINCEGFGGGLYASNSTITLDGVLVQNNCAANTPFYGQGGGLAFVNSPFTVTNTVVAANRSFNNDTSVGGLFAGTNGVVTANNSPGTLVNDTIADNKGQGVNTASALTLANTIVVGHTTGVKLTAAAAVTVKYNDFYNNTTQVSGFTLDSTNIVINPLLAPGYWPSRGSPCIDAGDNAEVPTGITQDIAGKPRFQDDPTKPDTGLGTPPIVDIGAYESDPDQGFHTVAPCRILDTRQAAGPLGGPALVAGAVRTFPLVGTCGIPAEATSVSLNVTVTQPSVAGDLRLFAGGTPLPLVSTINYHAGQTRANNAVATLGASGDLSVRCDQAAGTVQVIIDVNGYFQ